MTEKQKRQSPTCCRDSRTKGQKVEKAAGEWSCQARCQTVSERQATTRHGRKVPVNVELKPLRREKQGTEVQRYSTLKEAMKMWWNNLQFLHKTVTYILLIHTCSFERLDPMIVKDLEHHVTRKLLIWVNPCFHPTLAIILSHFTYGYCHLHVPCRKLHEFVHHENSLVPKLHN